MWKDLNTEFREIRFICFGPTSRTDFFKEFVIFEGDKEVGTTTGYIFELKRRDQQTLYRVKGKEHLRKRKPGR